MKLPFLLAVLALVSPALADDPVSSSAPSGESAPAPSGKPELRGMIVTGSEQRFLLASGSGGRSTWVSVGDSLGDWEVSSYRLKDGTLILKQKDGGELDLTMANSTVQAGANAKGTLEDAQRLFEKMHMAEMLAKMLDQQKKMIGGQFMQGLKRFQGNAKPEEMTAFQQQVLDKIFSGFDSQKIADNMAQIYSQEFSSDQLRDMADFYDSPTGQATIAKMPEIQMKQAQLIMPQIQAMIPQVNQIEKDFAAQHQPAAAASPAPPAAAHP
jgi:hypothetical protein